LIVILEGLENSRGQDNVCLSALFTEILMVIPGKFGGCRALKKSQNALKMISSISKICTLWCSHGWFSSEIALASVIYHVEVLEHCVSGYY